MNQVKDFAILLAKVGVAYALIAGFQKHVTAIPVVGAYLPKAP